MWELEKSELPWEQNFYSRRCVFCRTVSLPSFNGLCCKCAKIALLAYVIKYWVECMTSSMIRNSTQTAVTNMTIKRMLENSLRNKSCSGAKSEEPGFRRFAQAKNGPCDSLLPNRTETLATQASWKTKLLNFNLTFRMFALKWNHFEILAKDRSDTHCKIKETLLIQELKTTLNETVSSDKLYLY